MQILENQLLADYTTCGIGGRIRWMLFPENGQEIVEALNFAVKNRLPFFILAGGSNTIFEDENLKFRQLVINLTKLDSFQVFDQSSFSIIQVQPGLKLQKLVDIALTNKLSGISGLNRIPGTVGGAVVGNAGAYGTEIGSVVDSVELIDIKEAVKKILMEGEAHYNNLVHTLTADECQFGYRNSYFKDKNGLIVTNIKVKLNKVELFTSELENYNKIATIRDAVYPPGFPSPGSVFKNVIVKNLKPEILSTIPEDWIVYKDKIPVAKFLEGVGGKGIRQGQIGMRPTHANIMLNYGGAKFEDVKTLIENLKKAVFEKYQVVIEPEIRLVPGDFNKFKH